MSVEERLDRLEQRLSAVETLLRELVATAPRPVPAPPPPPRPVAETSLPTPPVPPIPPRRGPAAPLPPSPRPAFEQWIGQRGLLAVGVFALILAAGYLLKLSFDRGWISPAMRCAGGVVAGAGVGALGWRLLGRYRTYGAALIGCGAAIIYLAVWAASRLYGLLPTTTGIAGLALTSISLAAIAYAVNVEALGAVAVLGAFVAPVLLGHQGRADLLLLYLGCMGAGLGWVAAARRWRVTMALVAIAVFSLGWGAAALATRPFGALAYAVLGGAAGIAIGLRERWWETRLLAFWGGWALLATVADKLEPRWPIFVAGLVLAAPVWRHALRQPSFLPVRLELLYFFVTPILLGWAVRSLAPDLFAAEPGLPALAVAVPYLAAGYARHRPPFALVGAAALAVAALRQWSGLEQVPALLGLALLWAALDHRLGRSDGRWYAVLTLAVALTVLYDGHAPRRDYHDPAFTGEWALVLWLAAGVTLALAAWLWKREPPGEGVRLTHAGLWAVAGALVLVGVTGEIQRFFRLRAATAVTAGLASGLTVSAWWLVFAAALVVAGLRRDIRPARLAGLGVAGLAVLKVLVFDLSSLDALYRVGSVFILGLVSLLLAYLYHREARRSHPRTS
ncbi:MAG TPA: DUF2339 domain-containing protein [Gemmatimonadales bacterium]|nr:DUF2339 domain-containing protein [Gemmatimonadales bacterium]